MENNSGTRKKVIRVVLPLLLVIIVVVVILAYLGVIKLPTSSIPLLQKGPSVELKTDYKNPFAKETQFVNPFEQYKNPFETNK